MMRLWWNDDENYDETYDETHDVIAVNIALKWLAPMTGCWDPEFEPSVEEIIDYRWYMAILSICFLRQVCTLGGFPYSVEHMVIRWRSHLGQLAQAVPQYTCIQSMRSLSMCSKVDNGGVQ